MFSFLFYIPHSGHMAPPTWNTALWLVENVTSEGLEINNNKKSFFNITESTKSNEWRRNRETWKVFLKAFKQELKLLLWDGSRKNNLNQLFYKTLIC